MINSNPRRTRDAGGPHRQRRLARSGKTASRWSSRKWPPKAPPTTPRPRASRRCAWKRKSWTPRSSPPIRRRPRPPKKRPSSASMRADRGFGIFPHPPPDEYRYNQPVRLGPHRLVLRPRESRELRLVSMDITHHAAQPHHLGAATCSATPSPPPVRRACRQAGDREQRRAGTDQRRLAGLSHRRPRHRISLFLFRRRAHRSGRAAQPAISRFHGAGLGLGRRFCARQSHRHFGAAEGSQCRHLGHRQLSGARG